MSHAALRWVSDIALRELAIGVHCAEHCALARE